jgi:hypothetical protein
MAMKQMSPPTKSFIRVVQLETPGGLTIEIGEDDLVAPYNALDDEGLARAYCELTGLRATVRTVYQTTVSPFNPKYEEAAND